MKSLIDNEAQLLSFVAGELQKRGSEYSVPGSLSELSEESLSAVRITDLCFQNGMMDQKLALEVLIHRIELDGAEAVVRGLDDKALSNKVRDSILLEDLRLQDMLYAKNRGRLNEDQLFEKYKLLEVNTFEEIQREIESKKQKSR